MWNMDFGDGNTSSKLGVNFICLGEIGVVLEQTLHRLSTTIKGTDIEQAG
jgi:hypothetical protein